MSNKNPEQLSPEIMRQFTGSRALVSRHDEPQRAVHGRSQACCRSRRRLLAARRNRAQPALRQAALPPKNFRSGR